MIIYIYIYLCGHPESLCSQSLVPVLQPFCELLHQPVPLNHLKGKESQSNAHQRRGKD